MANYIDHINLNGNEADILGVGADHYYEGVDLTQLFADEISAYTSPWAWISARIKAKNFSQIHVGDYIPVVVNGATYKAQVAGIDTYFNTTDKAVPHHIDFITKELYSPTFKMNLVNFNNGVSAEAMHPWLTCNGYAFLNSLAMQVPNSTSNNPALTDVDYTAGGAYFYLPEELKKVIIPKRVYLPYRYSASEKQNDDNGGAWQDIGKLWLPSEFEVCGASVWGGKTYPAMFGTQYPIFANSMAHVKATPNGSRGTWWTMTATSGHSTYFVYVNINGYMYNLTASSDFRAPLCFRIA